MLYKTLDNECLKIFNKIGVKLERERFQDTTTILRYFSETRDVSRVPSDWLQSSCYKSATNSSKCGSEILHIHLEECHTSHCRARAILQTLCSCSRKTWLDSCSLVTSRLIPSTHASFFFTRRMCFCNVVTPNRCCHNGLVTSPRPLERKACEWNDQNR